MVISFLYNYNQFTQFCIQSITMDNNKNILNTLKRPRTRSMSKASDEKVQSGMKIDIGVLIY